MGGGGGYPSLQSTRTNSLTSASKPGQWRQPASRRPRRQRRQQRGQRALHHSDLPPKLGQRLLQRGPRRVALPQAAQGRGERPAGPRGGTWAWRGDAKGASSDDACDQTAEQVSCARLLPSHPGQPHSTNMSASTHPTTHSWLQECPPSSCLPASSSPRSQCPPYTLNLRTHTHAHTHAKLWTRSPSPARSRSPRCTLPPPAPFWCHAGAPLAGTRGHPGCRSPTLPHLRSHSARNNHFTACLKSSGCLARCHASSVPAAAAAAAQEAGPMAEGGGGWGRQPWRSGAGWALSCCAGQASRATGSCHERRGGSRNDVPAAYQALQNTLLCCCHCCCCRCRCKKASQPVAACPPAQQPFARQAGCRDSRGCGVVSRAAPHLAAGQWLVLVAARLAAAALRRHRLQGHRRRCHWQVRRLAAVRRLRSAKW